LFRPNKGPHGVLAAKLQPSFNPMSGAARTENGSDAKFSPRDQTKRAARDTACADETLKLCRICQRRHLTALDHRLGEARIIQHRVQHRARR
jgi:hypothetical protein